jgi:hypothetical protein
VTGTVVYIVNITDVKENGGIREQHKYFVQCTNIQGDSEVLSGVPFIGHGNVDNNLESPWRQ